MRAIHCVTWCVTWVALTTVSLAEGPGNGCKYELQVPEIKCNTGEIENRINVVSSKQEVSEERFSAMATAFKDELTVLSKDMSGTKTVVNRLVEDSVQIQSRVRILSDLGQDVVGLHKRVTDVDQKMGSLQYQMGQVEQASRSITSYMSSQMNGNKEILSTLKRDIDAIKATETTLLNKVAQLESGHTGQATGSQMQVGQLLKAIDDLQKELSGIKREFTEVKAENNSRMERLEGRLAEIEV